jgi:hypothetical protein
MKILISWKGLANLASLEAPFAHASGMVESYTWSFWIECHFALLLNHHLIHQVASHLSNPLKTLQVSPQ